MGLNDGGAAGGASGDGGQGGDGAGAGDASGLLGGAGAGAGGGDQQGGGAGDPDWYQNLSAEKDGEAPSHRDWIKAKGFKDLDGVTKALRSAEKAIHEKGTVKLPGEGATPEEVSAYHRAIGVPNEAKDYAFTLPKDDAGAELAVDQALLDRVAAKAHATGLPKAAFEATVNEFLQGQLEAFADNERQLQADATKWVKDQGKDSPTKVAAINTAVRVFGIDKDDQLALRAAWGSEKALNFMAKLGAGVSEDGLIGGSGRTNFGVQGSTAQAQLSERMKDRAWAAKASTPGTAENAEYDRLNSAAAAYAAQQADVG